MRKRLLRTLLKLGALANLALLAAVLWDYLQNDSRLMWPLLGTYAAFLLAMLLLFFARPQGPPTEPDAPQAADDGNVRMTIAQRP